MNSDSSQTNMMNMLKDYSECKQWDYLKLLNFFKLFQVWNQPYSIFESFQELHLECYHFSQIPKENIQLIREKSKMLKILLYS